MANFHATTAGAAVWHKTGANCMATIKVNCLIIFLFVDILAKDFTIFIFILFPFSLRWRGWHFYEVTVHCFDWNLSPAINEL